MKSSYLHWLLVTLLVTDSAVGHKLSGPLPHSQMLSVAPSPGHSSQDTLRSLLSALSASVEGRVRLHGNLSCSSLRRLPHGDSPLTLELLVLAELPLLLSAGCQQEALMLTRTLYKVLGREDTHAAIRQLTHLLRNSATLPTENNLTTSPDHSVYPENESVSTSDNSEISRDANSSNANGTSTGQENVTDLHNSTDSRHFGSNPQFTTMSDEDPQAECDMNALMFNIQQLARVGAGDRISSSAARDSCSGWLRVQGAQLQGQRVGKRGQQLHKAQHLCQRLGPKCVGVAQSGGPDSGLYQAVLGASSWVLPSHTDSGADCWLRQCMSGAGSGLVRVRRGAGWAPHQCVNHQEQQVYSVVEWVPAVSTLYNLGTAVYYASRNCTDVARERAILSAVDLGTDALMAITGGTVGVAGYALGAGVKTGVKAGVKYMMNNMNQGYSHDDVLVNQESWEDGTMTIQ
ncbi:hypothetical protein ACEWY4_013298 [Coilia grayii]|uniref:Apolipoprotein F n=1 Tax=Coilia grayii TaxID=363190 RepID=A0ABD1JW07_9TELE